MKNLSNEILTKVVRHIKFVLNGCDISFIAEAPEDMTVKQLVEQGSRIKPDWCACGICGVEGVEHLPVEIIFTYDDVRKADENVPCSIRQIREGEKIG